MALTSQIQESYLRLQGRADNLQQKTNQLDNQYLSIKLLVDLMSDQLTGGTPISQEALRDKVRLVDMSVDALNTLSQSLIPNLPIFAEIDHELDALQTENQTLKGLLSEIGSNSILAINPSVSPQTNSPDDCLLELITDTNHRDLTRQLLNGSTLKLESKQSNLLTAAWGKAMQAFIDDAQQIFDPDGNVLPGRPETITTFFCVRNQLVTLYNRLTLSVA